MEFMTPPVTTPKRHKHTYNNSNDLSSPSKSTAVIKKSIQSDDKSPLRSSVSSDMTVKTPPRPSPDRFIPNRADIDFDYCNSMLVPSSPIKETEKISSPNGSKNNTSVLLAGMEANKILGKRMISVFEKKSTSEQTVKPPVLKVL